LTQDLPALSGLFYIPVNIDVAICSPSLVIFDTARPFVNRSFANSIADSFDPQTIYIGFGVTRDQTSERFVDILNK